jgi:toxin FitB
VIVLDTNILSEISKPRPDGDVMSWINDLSGVPLYVSTTTESEIWAGIMCLPKGKRRSTLETVFSQLFDVIYAAHILPFDSRSARRYATIFAERQRLGRPIARADCEIAAIAATNGFKLATRNAKDFDHCGVEIINPWK